MGYRRFVGGNDAKKTDLPGAQLFVDSTWITKLQVPSFFIYSLTALPLDFTLVVRLFFRDFIQIALISKTHHDFSDVSYLSLQKNIVEILFYG